MKRIAEYLIVALAAVTVMACSEMEKDELPASKTGIITLTANLPEAEATKTSMIKSQGGKYKTVWTEGDILAVNSGSNETSMFSLSSGEGTGVGTFSGSGPVSGNMKAFYPYDFVQSCDGSVFNVVIPEEQQYKEGTFDTNTYPMYAQSNSLSLSFRNLCSVIQLPLRGHHTVTSITFKSNDVNTFVSGPATVTDGELTMERGGNNVITLLADNVPINESPTDFNIVVPAQTYKGGFTVTITTTTGSMEKSYDKDFQTTRSSIHTSSVIDVKLDEGVEPSTSLSGSGTKEDPFVINNLPDLLCAQSIILKENGSCFILKSDIDLSPVCGPGKGNWVPMANENNLYVGVFDGDGHAVKNLYIDSGEPFQGLFGCMGDDGIIRNLNVEGSVKGKEKVALICGSQNEGYYRSSIIINCTTKGKVESSMGDAGGIAGEGADVTGCTNYASVQGCGSYVGGIVGSSSDMVENCVNAGIVSNSGEYTGGIQGYQNAGKMINCRNEGRISGVLTVGGIAGYSRQGAMLNNCINVGEIYSTGDRVGGIVGFLDAYSFANFNTSLRNCINLGKVTTSSSTMYIGGICGYNMSTLENCYWLNDRSSGIDMPKGIGEDGGVSSGNSALTASQMKGEDAGKVLYTSPDGDTYSAVLDALNGWAYSNSKQNLQYHGWISSDRDGYPALSGYPAEKPVAGEVFTIEPQYVNIRATGGEFTITVTSTMAYQISSMPSWISQMSSSIISSNGTEYIFSARANDSAEERRGIIVFCNDNQVCIPVTVNQKGKSDEPDDDWINKEFAHKSLAMRFTATWCGYCPNLARAIHDAQQQMPGEIEVLNLHGGGSDLEFSQNYLLEDQFLITGFPTGVLDGRRYVENYGREYAAQLVVDYVNETKNNYPTVSGVSFESSTSGQTLTVDIKAYLKKAGSYKIAAFVTESGIIGYQADNYEGSHSNYEHNDIARIALSNALGDSFTIASDGQTKDFSYKATIPSGYNKNNLKILVFIMRAYGSQPVLRDNSAFGDYYVDNCASGKVGDDLPLAFKSDTTGGSEGIGDGGEIKW
ncbi:MAG: Omp28-related outer membrane protein [Bacteroidales bacterium]|nr:Omp28-related outer membrane protein [Bacteroidales bacterium]